MSRSFRKPYDYFCYGARPKQGKQYTSRYLRRKNRMYLKRGKIFYSHLDKNRGKAGSKDWGLGWVYFGDGRTISINDSKLTRK